MVQLGSLGRYFERSELKCSAQPGGSYHPSLDYLEMLKYCSILYYLSYSHDVCAISDRQETYTKLTCKVLLTSFTMKVYFIPGFYLIPAELVCRFIYLHPGARELLYLYRCPQSMVSILTA